MITLEMVRCALALNPADFDPRAAQLKMAPLARALYPPPEADSRLAATLMLIYPIGDRLHFALTRRNSNLNAHAGQISLPGGRIETGEPYEQAALRETCEEIGVCDPIEILGALTDLYIPPSNYLVYPFVGYMPERPDLKIVTSEVDEIIECPLDLLLDESIKDQGETEIRGLKIDIRWYQMNGYRVWGATAIMLSEMEWRLRTCLKR